ncbi:MAG TPA: AMP-binding protein [Kineosporiaceae bacterium]|nr:AMP-binding protein [Kineosporiaceae bacterium]
MPRSIPEAIAEGARSTGSLTVIDKAGTPRRICADEVQATAAAVAAALVGSGVCPGDRVCLAGRTSTDLLFTLFGLWRMGAVPVVLPQVSRGGIQPWVTMAVGRADAVDARMLIVDDELASALAQSTPRSVRTLAEVSAGRAVTNLAMPEPDALGLLQFTSATTGTSKAVQVSHSQIVGNVRALIEPMGIMPGEVYVSWLPLFHDMGIISLASGLAYGMEIVLLPTEAFLRAPGIWMGTVSRFGAVITAGPNSAYGLAARSQQLRPAVLDLSRLVVAIDGAEPVTEDVVQRMSDAFTGSGLRPDVLCPAYGLAESTLVVTASGRGELPRFISPADVCSTGTDGVELPTRRLVSCGRGISGTEVRIIGPAGQSLPEGAVGEVHVLGPWITTGYWQPDGAGPDPGRRSADGALATGDLGFLRDGELFICGRTKDMIIVGGRNLYPEDYEEAAELVTGIVRGNVIAFSLVETERMVIVAEGRGDSTALQSLAVQLRERLQASTEHAPEEVVLVRAGTLPKTSSGKRQRQQCRTQYQNGDLEIIHTLR